MKKIIGLVGEIGSGKEIFAKLLKEVAKDKSLAHIRFSDILRGTLNAWSLPLSRENFTKLRIIMNKNFGEDALPKATIEGIKNKTEDIIILDGLRWFTDLVQLKKLPNSVLVYITASLNVRYQRIAERAEKTGESKISIEEFGRRNQSQAEALIPQLGAKADFALQNEGTIEEFKEKVKEFYEKYLT